MKPQGWIHRFDGLTRLALLVCAAVLSLVPADAVAKGTDGVVQAAGSPPAGLMWNRTGLPLVFPLQVRSAPGNDYVVTLLDTDTGTPLLAAYIRGGSFFSVLVPPGTFDVTFATGVLWRGEDEQFGPGDSTRRFSLPEPLTFGVKGIGTKAGHIVDITGEAQGEVAQATVGAQSICQRLERVQGQQRLQKPDTAQGGFTADDPDLRWDTMVPPTGEDQLAEDLLQRPTTVYEWVFTPPGFGVVSRPC